MNNINIDEEILPISKTKRKQQMSDLQDLGIELTKISKDKLRKLELNEELTQAILDCHKITANGATRRQYQYIGKLMRTDNIDPQEVKDKLGDLSGESVKYNRTLHLSEKWRTLLLESDDNLPKFIETYGNTDITHFRSLIRSVRKENGIISKNYKILYRLIRDSIESTSHE